MSMGSFAAPITAILHEVLPWLWETAPDLPAPVRSRAQRLWLDSACCAWSGLRSDTCLQWLALQAQAEPGMVALPGSDVRLGVGAGAFALAMGSCWDEACEGLALAHGRPGIPVFAALWSQVGNVRPTWEALWRASAVGYEVGARMGARLRIRSGHHVDGMWSAFGAAVALAHLHGLRWQDALAAMENCAVQLPYSLYQPITQGANVRNQYLAHSSWLALQAEQAVRAGISSPVGAIDTFARLALDSGEPEALEGPGHWRILDSYWKPFAGVRHVQYGVQAALRLREQLGDPEAIEELELVVYPEALMYCANRDPGTPIAAQFSLGFGVAAALVFGDLSPAQYRSPQFEDARLRRLERLLDIRADKEFFPTPQRGACLSARVHGQWLRVVQGPMAGDPGFDPDVDAVLRKFHHYTEGDAAMARWAGALQHDPSTAAAIWPEYNQERAR